MVDMIDSTQLEEEHDYTPSDHRYEICVNEAPKVLPLGLPRYLHQVLMGWGCLNRCKPSKN